MRRAALLTSSSTSLRGILDSEVASSSSPSVTVISHALTQIRNAGSGVPEFWGKPSAYTEGTGFLGTPSNHQELLKKRPLSPDVFSIDKPSFHYAMPWGARSSILNRATGVALSVGFSAAGAVALVGDLPAALTALKASYPLLILPIKLVVAYPIVYHYLGGVRHLIWDFHTIGNQMDHGSLLEKEKVEDYSKKMIFAALGLSALVSLL